MKFSEYITEGKIPDNIKAISAIEKFVGSLDDPTRYREDKFHDYKNSRIIITNKYTGYINYFGTIVKKSSESSKVPVTVTQRHVKIIGGEEVTDVSISVGIQLGSNPGSSNYYSETNTLTDAGVNKAYKEALDKAKKDTSARVKVLASILTYRKPMTSDEISKNTNIGIGSAASTNVKHSYDKVIDIKALTKIFTEDEFREAARTDFGMKKDRISFNFKKGLMDRSGTWTETWD